MRPEPGLETHRSESRHVDRSLQRRGQAVCVQTGEMACRRAAAQRRGPDPLERRNGWNRRVDPAKEAEQPPCCHPSVDLAVSEPEGSEFAAREDLPPFGHGLAQQGIH